MKLKEQSSSNITTSKPRYIYYNTSNSYIGTKNI